MSNELTVYQKGQMIETIDDFVSTVDPDKKLLFLGAFSNFIENEATGDKSALYMTASILYARIFDRLQKDDDKLTMGMINIAIGEYMEKAGVDMEKYKWA